MEQVKATFGGNVHLSNSRYLLEFNGHNKIGNKINTLIVMKNEDPARTIVIPKSLT